jgi:hypothetical protein
MRRHATVLALGLGLAIVIYPIAKVSDINGISAIGGLGLGSLVAALTWRTARPLAVGAVILIALHYALTLHAARAGLDPYSILIGAGLFLLWETTDLSISLADVAPTTRPALTYRSTTTLATAAAGALLAIVGVLAQSLFSGGLLTIVLGATCALGVIALSVWLAQRPRGTGEGVSR